MDVLGKLLSDGVFGGTPSKKEKKKTNMAAAARRRAEERLCVSAKWEVGRERRVARVAPGGAGKEVKSC